MVVAAGCAGCLDGRLPGDQTDGSASGDGTATRTYIVGIDGNYYPFSYIEKDGQPSGFDVESILWIAEEMDFEVIIKPIAWEHIIPSLEEKRIDIIYSGMTITDDRRARINFSTPYRVVNQGIVVRADSGMTMDDILGGNAVIGTQRGCSAEAWIRDNLVQAGTLPADRLVLKDSIQLSLSELMSGDIDAVMYDEPVIAWAIRDKPLRMAGVVETNEEYAIAVRKEDTELLEMLNEGLDRLMRSSKWQELIRKYGLE
ncbi:extracellular solute-binding protein, family 3 [hydrocarbon metagenome]|uniref:Extracellular solute-binding protein, family 3 n=1 Tax=hydrocarbon metagenome TaxID=938273 RepID=A0A0W8FJ31_9ZZZZ